MLGMSVTDHDHTLAPGEILLLWASHEGLTLSEISERTGIPVSCLSEYARGLATPRPARRKILHDLTDGIVDAGAWLTR